MPAFLGQLKSNEIFSAIYNMIISQEVHADNIGKHQTLVDKARVDGGLFGDTKLYYSTDALKSVAWGNDAEATNLLALHRPPSPSCQAITLDQFRQVSLTVDNYLQKRAFSTEGAFASFNSVMLGWIGETKKIYDGTLYNTYIGTVTSNVGKQSQTLVLGASLTAEERAKYIAEKIANLMVEMGDYNRDFNDYGYLRSYSEDAINVVWNAKYVNEIRKIDLPAIFHKDGLMDKFTADIIPAKYFGDLIADVTTSTYADATPTTAKPVKVASSKYTYEPVDGNTVELHVKEEIDLPVYVGSAYTMKHFFAGDVLPTDGKVAIKGTFTIDGTSTAVDFKDKFYKTNDKVICKLFVKLPPYMSAFEVGTSFFNPKSLTESHFLTWGHNTVEYLLNYPVVTITETAE